MVNAMKCSLFILLLLTGCTSRQPYRSIASLDSICGEADLSKSHLKMFSSTQSVGAEAPKRYFYLVLRDDKGGFVECESSDMAIKKSNGRRIKFTYHRSSEGQYYLIPSTNDKIIFEDLEIYVRDRPIKKKIKYSVPSNKVTSTIKLSEHLPYKAVFLLKIKDSSSDEDIKFETPEIMLEGGHGFVDEIEQINKTTWKFSLIYPEENQIIYVSTRTNGTLLSNTIRFQHVEK